MADPANTPPVGEQRLPGMDHTHHAFRTLTQAPRFEWPDSARIAFTVTLVLVPVMLPSTSTPPVPAVNSPKAWMPRRSSSVGCAPPAARNGAGRRASRKAAIPVHSLDDDTKCPSAREAPDRVQHRACRPDPVQTVRRCCARAPAALRGHSAGRLTTLGRHASGRLATAEPV